jgi:hypothetical protein
MIKNTIKLLSTDGLSIIQFGFDNKLYLDDGITTRAIRTNKHIYICSSTEPLALGGYHFNSKYGDEVCKTNQRDIDSRKFWEEEDYVIERIIFTTDLKLIEDNIQKVPINFIKYYIEIANDSGVPIDFVESKLVFANPMGREVDPNNVHQNHSECTWKYKLIYAYKNEHGLFSCCRNEEECYCNKNLEKEDFLTYIENERKNYTDFIGSLVWDNATRVKATSLLIAFDQMKEKLIENKII